MFFYLAYDEINLNVIVCYLDQSITRYWSYLKKNQQSHMLRTMEIKYGCLLRKEDISIKMMAFCCCFVWFFLEDFSMWWAKFK